MDVIDPTKHTIRKEYSLVLHTPLAAIAREECLLQFIFIVASIANSINGPPARSTGDTQHAPVNPCKYSKTLEVNLFQSLNMIFVFIKTNIIEYIFTEIVNIVAGCPLFQRSPTEPVIKFMVEKCSVPFDHVTIPCPIVTKRHLHLHIWHTMSHIG